MRNPPFNAIERQLWRTQASAHRITTLGAPAALEQQADGFGEDFPWKERLCAQVIYPDPILLVPCREISAPLQAYPRWRTAAGKSRADDVNDFSVLHGIIILRIQRRFRPWATTARNNVKGTNFVPFAYFALFVFQNLHFLICSGRYTYVMCGVFTCSGVDSVL